ncbi:MAG: AEC family transporter, partial [Oscillospiraceae bacterium]|nr:AEC family transporter [Oscillospiraceae bacterium]
PPRPRRVGPPRPTIYPVNYPVKRERERKVMDSNGAMQMQVGEKVISLFLILFAGIIAGKTNIIGRESAKRFSSLLLNVTQPLLIITSFQIDFDAAKLKNGLTVLALSAAIHIFTAAAAFLIYKPIKKSRNVFEMSTVFCNCAFLGFPVLIIIFGEELGVFYGAFYTMFFNIFIWTYGVYLVSRKDKKDKTKSGKINLPASKIFLNAGVIASVTGIVFFVSGIRMTPVLFDSAKLVGDMTFPLSMLIVGSLISEIKLKELFGRVRNYYYVFIKLIFLPVFIAYVCVLLRLPPLLIYMGTVMTSMPGAANAAVFAEKYGADSKTASVIVGLSTLASVITIPAAIYFLNNIAGIIL